MTFCNKALTLFEKEIGSFENLCGMALFPTNNGPSLDDDPEIFANKLSIFIYVTLFGQMDTQTFSLPEKGFS